MPMTVAGYRLHGGHLIVLLLAALCIALAVRAAAAIRVPLPAPPPMPAPAVADRDLLARLDPFFGPAPNGETLPVTSLPLSLHGVRWETATGRGSAILALADGQQTVFLIGDEVSDGVRLVAVALDHVVLERDGVREALWMANASGSQPAAPAETGSVAVTLAAASAPEPLPPELAAEGASAAADEGDAR